MDISASEEYETTSRLNGRKLIVVMILLTANLLNYMDRFTIAGVLTQLQAYYHITDDDSRAGLLQTAFIVFYMLFSPLFGYLGDRCNRKVILSVGILVWVLAVFISTLISSSHFYVFLFFRGVVGIGEASYSTVAPTIIADLFRGSARSIALTIFYFAIPVGSGLGYMTGSYVSKWLGAWQWGVRLTSVLGMVCLCLIIFVLEEPARGEADHAHVEKSSFTEDLKYLFKIKTYIFSTLGFTAIIFLVGSLSWWTPTLMEHAWAMLHGTSQVDPDAKARISSTFGAITCFAGLVGVILGSSVAQAWKKGKFVMPSKKADPFVCSFGAFIAVPFLYLAVTLSSHHFFSTWVFIFLGVTCCCLNWAVNMDMLMYILVPQRRSTGTAIQTMLSHLLGDATSPYLIGLVSDCIRGKDASVFGRFFALQDALYMPIFLLVIAGGFYLAASFYVEKDKEIAYIAMHASDLQPIVINANQSTTSSILDAVEQEIAT